MVPSFVLTLGKYVSNPGTCDLFLVDVDSDVARLRKSMPSLQFSSKPCFKIITFIFIFLINEKLIKDDDASVQQLRCLEVVVQITRAGMDVLAFVHLHQMMPLIC
jgi:hypothetical protein